jgi:hypothetical protein
MKKSGRNGTGFLSKQNENYSNQEKRKYTLRIFKKIQSRRWCLKS